MTRRQLALAALALTVSAPAHPADPDRSLGLLTEDRGIITNDDLRREAAIARPEPIIRDRVSGFPVWQCFPTREYSMRCDSAYGLSREHGWGYRITVEHAGHRLEFDPNRAFEREWCAKVLGKWKKIASGQDFMCVCGTYVEEGPLSARDRANGITRRSGWILRELKSKAGHWQFETE